jgi:hypothetical protein
MVVRILSIDFDYFIDASAAERDLYFPDGCEEVDSDKLKAIWEERYLKYPKLKQVGVIEDFNFIRKYLLGLKIPRDNFIEADNHKVIKGLIDALPTVSPIYIVNIDFHHDYYHYYKGKDNCNCGNWLRRVTEERPDTRVLWIRRRDSQVMCLDGAFPYEHGCDIKIIHNESFDYAFLCRSPEWSPPHLICKYEELVDIFSTKIA